MASGALVASFHGYGGQEYATSKNGLWFAPDHLEEAADALARLIGGFTNNDPDVVRMRKAGFATAAHYSKEVTRTALLDFYSPLLN